MHWLILAGAICSEVFGSAMLKLSQGFTKPVPSVIFVIAYIVSFYLLSLALKNIPLGTAYAIWAGVGLVLTALVSVFFFGQKVDLMGIIAIGLILLGVILLNTFSDMAKH